MFPRPLLALGALALSTSAANAATFSLTAVTNTTPNFAGTILITGTVTVGAGEIFLNPNVMSTVNLPFLSSFTAGFNGPGQTWDAGFLAWSGVGTYTGAIFNHQISSGNLGFSGGMPLGLYSFNPLGPGGSSSLVLNYIDANGTTQSMVGKYAINVIPSPGPLATLALGTVLVTRRRRACSTPSCSSYLRG